MTDRLIRVTTALAVVTVAVVAAIISYQHAYELVRSHGESGVTARLLPFTVDGLIWAASMVVLDASHRNQPVPRLAAWSLGAGIVATVGANLAHGTGRGPVGVLVSAWPALALVDSFELLMVLIRTGRHTSAGKFQFEPQYQTVPPLVQEIPPDLTVAPTLEQAVCTRYEAGHSQRAIARELNIDRRKVKRIIDQAACHVRDRPHRRALLVRRRRHTRLPRRQFDKDWSKISEIEEYRLDWSGRRYVVRTVRHRALILDEPFWLTVAFEDLQAP